MNGLVGAFGPEAELDAIIRIKGTHERHRQRCNSQHPLYKCSNLYAENTWFADIAGARLGAHLERPAEGGVAGATGLNDIRDERALAVVRRQNADLFCRVAAQPHVLVHCHHLLRLPQVLCGHEVRVKVKVKVKERQEARLQLMS